MLSREMTLVRNECSRLIPPVSERMRDKFRIAFYSFWNRKKVEDLVLELKSRIDSCYRDFSVRATISDFTLWLSNLLTAFIERSDWSHCQRNLAHCEYWDYSTGPVLRRRTTSIQFQHAQAIRRTPIPIFSVIFYLNDANRGHDFGWGPL